MWHRELLRQDKGGRIFTCGPWTALGEVNTNQELFIYLELVLNYGFVRDQIKIMKNERIIWHLIFFFSFFLSFFYVYSGRRYSWLR